MTRRSGPIRVAVVAPALAPAGGLCRWSRELVRSLEMVAEPEELTIDVLVRTRMDFTESTIQQYGLRCRAHDLPVGGRSRKARLLSVRNTTRVMRSLSPDVVHVPLSWLWLLADRSLSRPKIVATSHAEPSREHVHAQDLMLARWLTTRNRIRLLTNAPSLRADLDRLVGVRPGTAISLPVATDPILSRRSEIDAANLRSELDVGGDEPIVVTVCRLVPDKRVDKVLDVIDLARQEGRRMRFVICGDGPAFGPLLAEAERRQMEGWVHFLGHVPEIERILLESDVMLSPSASEGGIPFAMVQGLLAGLPVVATAVGGMKDLIVDDSDGCLVPGSGSGDAVGLYRGLREISDQLGDRQDRAKRAEVRFGLQAMGKAHVDLIRNLVDR